MSRLSNAFWHVLAWLAYDRYLPDATPPEHDEPYPPPRTPSGASNAAGLDARYIPPSEEAIRAWEERRRLAKGLAR